MGSMSNYLENKVLDHIFGKATYTASTVYVGLSTADPLEDGSGLAEPSGGSYARVETSTSDWTAASGGLLSNANDITFPEATGSWGTCTHFALFDAATAGNMLYYGALTASKSPTSGDVAKFAAGDLTISQD